MMTVAVGMIGIAMLGMIVVGALVAWMTVIVVVRMLAHQAAPCRRSRQRTPM